MMGTARREIRGGQAVAVEDPTVWAWVAATSAEAEILDEADPGLAACMLEGRADIEALYAGSSRR